MLLALRMDLWEPAWSWRQQFRVIYHRHPCFPTYSFCPKSLNSLLTLHPYFALHQLFIHQHAKLILFLDQILSHLWGKKVLLHRCQCFSHGFVASIGRGDHLAQYSINEIWKVSPRVAMWAGRKTRTIILLFWWPVGKTLWSVIVFS